MVKGIKSRVQHFWREESKTILFRDADAHFSPKLLYLTTLSWFPIGLENLENGKTFSSQGNVREFLTDWNGKVREIYPKYWKSEIVLAIFIFLFFLFLFEVYLLNGFFYLLISL